MSAPAGWRCATCNVRTFDTRIRRAWSWFCSRTCALSWYCLHEEHQPNEWRDDCAECQKEGHRPPVEAAP